MDTNMPGDGDGDGDPGDGDGDPGDGDGDPGDGDGDPGDGDGDPGEVDPERIADACEDYCVVEAECDESGPACQQDCIEDISESEPGCVLQQVEVTECIAALDCADYDLYMSGDPFGDLDYPCRTEDVAVADCAGWTSAGVSPWRVVAAVE